MKIFLSILGVLLLAILGMVIFAPTNVAVETSEVIPASKTMVFQEVLTFKARDAWNPWTDMDPNIKQEIIGEDGTVGAKYRWEGNSDVGSGEQEITAIEGMDKVDTKLIFTAPWESEADTYMKLEEVEGGTKVSWGFSSEAPRPTNAMMLFMKGAIEKDYNKGLKRLKKLIEDNPMSFEIREKEMPETYYVGKRSTINMADITAYFTEVFPAAFAYVGKSGINATGNPMGLYYSYAEDGSSTDLAAVIPIENGNIVGSDFDLITIPAGKALVMDYYGDYNAIDKGHDEFEAYLLRKGLKRKFPVAEQYITDPTTVDDPSKILTQITYWLE
ncbi:MAG: SRPBCC family protein [Bacteroidia bacterium]|nr:SRPBCC family protein [Bacteroidia bacterium]